MSFVDGRTRKLLVGLVFIITMALENSTAFVPVSSTNIPKDTRCNHDLMFLIPSQVQTTRRLTPVSEPAHPDHTASSSKNPSLQLVPSQVKRQPRRSRPSSQRRMSQSNETAIFSSAPLASPSPSTDGTSTNKKRKRRRTKRRKHMTTNEYTKNGKTRRRRLLMGNLPDIQWRAIPMDHLRLHPMFIKLPTPESIVSLDSVEDVRLFSQDSWQWDALHEGRCTTSKAAAALGLLEPEAGHALNIPVSWKRGGKAAYYRLREKPLRTLEEMNSILCEGVRIARIPEEEEVEEGPVWVVPSARKDGTVRFPFAAKYLLKITPEERKERRRLAEQHAPSFLSVRLSWGNAQEATSILTALNYFWKHDFGVRIKEVGMCGASLSWNQTDDSVLVGASPDGILCHSNGTIEVLEVKNHCPFVPASYAGEDDRYCPQFVVQQIPFRRPITVPPLYVPQLQMEMLCVGPECRSAVMVRQTASNGAAIMRMYRNDEWIDEMLYWLSRFQKDFVDKEMLPPTNFFWDSKEDGDRYKRFIEWTKELSSEVEVLDIVKHNDIQRVVATSRNITSLFLD